MKTKQKRINKIKGQSQRLMAHLVVFLFMASSAMAQQGISSLNNKFEEIYDTARPVCAGLSLIILGVVGVIWMNDKKRGSDLLKSWGVGALIIGFAPDIISMLGLFN